MKTDADKWGIGYLLGQALNYIIRAGKRKDRLEFLRKAREMIDAAIDKELKDG